MRRLLTVIAAIGVGAACRRQLVRLLTKATGTWIGTPE